MTSEFNKFLNSYLSELVNSILATNISNIYKASLAIKDSSKKKKTIFVCGNGGSAAISNHYVADYLKLLRQKSSLKPKIISLSNNLETISAIGNDINFDQIFKFQAESLCQKGDLMIVISSSGNSNNIKEVVKYAKKKGVKIIGFSGFDGGFLKRNSDISIHINANNYGISEDAHHILMHVVLQFLIKFNEKK